VRGYPGSVEALAAHIQQPRFPELLVRFLYDQLHPNSAIPSDQVPLAQCPVFGGRISVFHSAIARFFAPSDLCGAGGMYQERIRSNPNWRGEYCRNDTVFVEINSDVAGMLGIAIGRIRLFFSFAYGGRRYPCALVEWFTPGNEPDDDTGMWVVRPEFQGNGRRTLAIIHLECIARAAHLMPVFGSSFVPEELHFSDSLDVYRAYFVNNYIDHHCNEFLS
jgi:hypothetical protein